MWMRAIRKKDLPLKIQFEAARGQSICGGLPVIEQLCRRFGLWPKLAGLRGIDPRKD